MFELKLGRIGHERSSNLPRVRATVRQRIGAKARPKARIAPKTGIRAHFRKGSAGKARPSFPTPAPRRREGALRDAWLGQGRARCGRMSAIWRGKAKLPRRGEPGLERSVDYLQRAETPGNARFAFYDRSEIGIDGKAITAGWAEDSRHFRLIISRRGRRSAGRSQAFYSGSDGGAGAQARDQARMAGGGPLGYRQPAYPCADPGTTGGWSRTCSFPPG